MVSPGGMSVGGAVLRAAGLGEVGMNMAVIKINVSLVSRLRARRAIR